MPSELQKSTLDHAHQGHQGIIKTKQLLRQKVLWPDLDKDVDTMIGQCLSCQAQGARTNPKPLHMSPMPAEPWHTLHIDLCGPFAIGESLLVLVDACSRWPAVEILRTTTAPTIIHYIFPFWIPRTDCIGQWASIHLTRVQNIPKELWYKTPAHYALLACC